MTISIIVPVRDKNIPPRCLASLESSKFDTRDVEVLIIEGRNPSFQRNLAASSAKGEILYFLDDDSSLDPRTLARLVEAFEDHPEAAGIGGPSVGTAEGTLFQKCAAMAMGSLFGLGPLRHRYYPSGCSRKASESELILSNLALRKDVWNSCGGLDPRLFPNEENELIYRLETLGHRFRYHPDILVFRPARQNLLALARQVFGYGASRAQHLRIRVHPLNVMLFLPSLLVLVVCALAAVWIAEGPRWIAWFLSAGVGFYSALAFLASLYAGLSVSTRRTQTFLLHLCIYPVLHLGYGIGFFRGFLSLSFQYKSLRTSAVLCPKSLGTFKESNISSI